MKDARDALKQVFTAYLKEKPPKEWADAFKEAAGMAYNLQYMFREDMGKAIEMFKKALDVPHLDSPHEGFGSERKMFSEMLDKALKIYVDGTGSGGLVNQQALKKTNFTSHPEELIKVVEDSSANAEPKLKLIAEMTAMWMEMCIDQKKMPLTPHHTQVLAMLLFSEFFDNKDRLSKPLGPDPNGGHPGQFNFNATIMQMKTGEGKSIVIAMLAVFVVLHYGLKVGGLKTAPSCLAALFMPAFKLVRRFTFSRITRACSTVILPRMSPSIKSSKSGMASS